MYIFHSAYFLIYLSIHPSIYLSTYQSRYISSSIYTLKICVIAFRRIKYCFLKEESAGWNEEGITITMCIPILG